MNNIKRTSVSFSSLPSSSLLCERAGNRTGDETDDEEDEDGISSYIFMEMVGKSCMCFRKEGEG